MGRVVGQGVGRVADLAPEHPQVAVNPALAPELVLRGVREGIVGAGFLEGVSVVAPLPRIGGVFPQRPARPLRKGLAGVVFRDLEAPFEAEFPPGDELVEKGFRALAHSPPAGAPARRFGAQAGGFPGLVGSDAVEDLVGGDVAEMQVGGQTAGRVAFGVVPVGGVAGEPVLDEGGEAGGGSVGAAGQEGGVAERVGGAAARIAHGVAQRRVAGTQHRRAHSVVDGEPGDEGGRAGEVGGGPPGEDGGRDGGRRAAWDGR